MAQPHPQPDPPSSTHPHPGRQPLNSISTRIIFFVFLSTFLTALVVSWISIQTIHSHLRSQVEAQFPAILNRRVGQLDLWLEEGRAALAQSASARKLGAGRSSRRQRAERLATLLEASPRFRGLALIAADGSLLARAGEIDDELLHPSETNGTADEAAAFSVPASSDPAKGALVLTRVPLPQRAKRPGVTLVGSFRLDELRQRLQLEPDEGPGRIFLVDGAGALVLTAPAEAPQDAETAVPLPRLLRAGAGQVQEYTGPEGQPMLGSAEWLGTIDWLLVMEAPFDRVFAPVLAVVTRIFLSDLVIIILFSFLAYKITAAIMQPIEALSEGATRISQGDVEHEIPTPRSNDEIGLLTRAFNDMMRKLRRSQQETEQDKLRLTEQNEELQRANEVLAQLSITDGLTRLHNHRYFQDHLTREIKRLSRTGEPLSMILIDLDDFKRLNDRCGHSAGDEVLVGIAKLMNDSVRESDLLARYGGEEFVILTPDTDLSGAVALAEKVRMAVEQASQIVDDSMRPARVTISCGVAEYRGDRRLFFQAADRALYRAKAEGKNCVIAEQPES